MTDTHPWLQATPSPPGNGATPLDVVWCISPDGPIALCWPCKREAGLQLLDKNGKEPYTRKKCSLCSLGATASLVAQTNSSPGISESESSKTVAPREEGEMQMGLL